MYLHIKYIDIDTDIETDTDVGIDNFPLYWYSLVDETCSPFSSLNIFTMAALKSSLNQTSGSL